MLTPVLISIAAVVVLFVIVVTLRPNNFRVTRSAKMAASASKVFEQVNDFRHWEDWSPWAKLDRAIKQTYEGASAGTGAIYTWNGNSSVGEGRQTIIESRPNELIRIKLEFVRPFKGTNDVEFTFQPEGNQTLVTWSMAGQYIFFTKAFGLFVSIDKIISGNFDKGLAAMKLIVEAKL